MITVRYIGPDAAILAGSYIYHGETRLVAPAQLAEAQIFHPDSFAIVEDAAEPTLQGTVDPGFDPNPPTIDPHLASNDEPAPVVAPPPSARPAMSQPNRRDRRH